jgi:RimJ/RimL family protein N-acetyltransferase
LEFGFEDRKLESIKAIAPNINLTSKKVMEKIGTKYIKDFEHPALKDNKRLANFVIYEINRTNF